MNISSDVIEFNPRKGKGSAILDLYLFAANCEVTIAEYLLKNGTMLDPKTRFLMASIRDQSGIISQKLKSELDRLTPTESQ